MTTATSKGFDYRQIAHTNMYRVNRPKTALEKKEKTPERPRTAMAEKIALTSETLQKFKDENK